MREFKINENDAGQRIDKFLTKTVPLLPLSMLYKAIRLKRVKLNGKRCQQSEKLKYGDVLSLYLNDCFFESVQDSYAFLKAPVSLEIIYEDENIMLCDKRPGLLVHEDDTHQTDTLINRILHYLYDKGEYNPENENSFTPSLCNRIDRNTGGIVLAAKNAASLRVLNEKLRQREIEKQYLCIAHGAMPKQTDTLKAYLKKDSAQKQVSVSSEPTSGARTILTRYHVLDQNERFSLLQIDLLTGRTHQIRAHLAFIGHPLLGDTKYGFNRDNKDTGFKFQALYAFKLTFAFKSDAAPLDYLCGKSFRVPRVGFYDDFMSGKII